MRNSFASNIIRAPGREMNSISLKDILGECLEQEIRSLASVDNTIDIEQLMTTPITGVATDSRLVKSGDLFLAYAGITVDSREFVDVVVRKGVAVVLVERSSQWSSIFYIDGIFAIPIDNLPQKMSLIASRFYGHPSHQARVIGVTGTNGKTSTSQFIAVINSLRKNKSAVIGTIGAGFIEEGRHALVETGFTTPDAVSLQSMMAGLVKKGAQLIAMEVSSHSLDQYRADGVLFNTVVFTNLTHDHLDYHGDMTSYQSAKQRLFEFDSIKNKVINFDDSFGRQLLATVAQDGISYSVEDASANIFASRIRLTQKGISCHIRSPWGAGDVSIPLMGVFNLSNCLAALGALCSEGAKFDDITACFKRLSSVPGRMQMVNTGVKEPLVIIDYAHTPDALEKMLKAVRQHCHGELSCVFGCGGDRDKVKRAEMGRIASELAETIVVTSDNPRSEKPELIIKDILSGILTTNTLVIEEDRAKAIFTAIQSADEKDIVILAGKGHEKYQEIDGEKIAFSDLKYARLALSERHSSENRSSTD